MTLGNLARILCLSALTGPTFANMAPAYADPVVVAPPAPALIVPGDDIFGFSNTSDPGNPGDLQYFNENDGRLGKRDGTYGALNSKFALGYTFAPNWWIGGAFFTAFNKTGSVTDLPNVDHLNFDGLSVELLHRIIERSQSNPFGVTLSVEPRWSRTDAVTGLSSQSYQSTFKLFMDAPITPGALYWDGNLQLTLQNAQDPMNVASWLPSSQLLASTAVTYQPLPNVFMGAEARYFTLSDNYTLSHEIGRALYLGPTFLWKITDKVALNATLQPQVYGHSRANPARSLDLDNFERAQFRAKLVVAF